MSEQADTGTPQAQPSRRDFIVLTTATFGAVGAIAAAWPIIASMSPSADVKAAGDPVTLDLSQIQPGQQISFFWQGKPIVVLHRTAQALAELSNSSLIARLSDPDSSALQQPDYAKNWCRSVKPEFMVLISICTHLGCIPIARPEVGDASIDASWPGGYFCPCHGSKYDLAGRVFRGVPAPYNLPVPPHRYDNDTTLVVGENPAGEDFSLSSIEQL